MAKVLSALSNHTLDALLELICVELQLTDTQDERARSHYAAVSSWLARRGSPLHDYSPHVYPQGSQRLGTTTRPYGKTEFDLDAVCKLDIDSSCHPGELYQLIWDRLSENETYRPMMRRMPRCIRLEYSNSFHLDIAPAVPDPKCGGTCILVPDLKANLALLHPENDRWKSSNPMGYGDWYDDQCVPVWPLTENYMKAGKVDPVPNREPVHAKPALKRSTQLFKRWRDVEYTDRGHLAPPSIILTTLSGHHYRRQQLCTEALDSILRAIVHQVETLDRIRLTNPAHPTENICEKWDSNPAAYTDFSKAVTAFQERWLRLRRVRGLQKIESELNELFGESPVRAAIRAFTNQNVITPRDNGSLRLHTASGLVSPVAATGSIRVPKNTFHGDAL